MLASCSFLFFFKQKTAYEMRISDWSSDVCSSDLPAPRNQKMSPSRSAATSPKRKLNPSCKLLNSVSPMTRCWTSEPSFRLTILSLGSRSEEHTSELQSLMRISYAVFCLKKKKQ